MLNISPQIYLWGLGVMQPASATVVRCFIEAALPNASKGLETKDVKKSFSELYKAGLICHSSQHANFIFSLTHAGNKAIKDKLRFHRDKARLFMLKDVALSARNGSGLPERGKELTGDSPVLDVRVGTQSRRPICSVVGSADRAYWSSAFKQLKYSAGPVPRSNFSDKYQYYSFENISDLSLASGHAGLDVLNLDIRAIALSIGISWQLMMSIMNNPEKNYRTFFLEKASGGTRTIRSPRIFLKTIQYWLKDYILYGLPVHECCHAYRKNRSIQTNASNHLGKKYIANLDIKKYFDSITLDGLSIRLNNFFSEKMSRAISKLCTVENILPQGAPTSPILSNFYLNDFDTSVANMCSGLGASYTRYADDITISADRKDVLHCIMASVEKILGSNNLELNASKVRVVSKSGQQNVTGVVVNEKLQPSRKFRKIIRSMFHHVALDVNASECDRRKLCGYLNYLKSFDALKTHKSTLQYQAFVDSMNKKFGKDK